MAQETIETFATRKGTMSDGSGQEDRAGRTEEGVTLKPGIHSHDGNVEPVGGERGTMNGVDGGEESGGTGDVTSSEGAVDGG